MRSSRRQFLRSGGAAALALVAGSELLAACGSSSAKAFTLAPRVSNGKLLVPGESRVAVSLVDASQTLMSTGPKTLTGSIHDSSDKIVAKVSADRHDAGIPQAYWPFRFTIDKPGFYKLRVDGDDGHGGDFGVFDPAEVTMPFIGSKIAPFDTPTVADHRGVEPYCSLTPNPCTLHDITLTDALKSGKPVAYMVGTPAHCQTGACAPALEFLVAAHQRIGSAMSMVHADVYADNAGTKFAPAVDALGIDYEPVVYLCKPGGAIADRLDGIWDQIELDARLAALTG